MPNKHKSYSHIFIVDSAKNIATLSLFVCLMTLFTFNYNFSEISDIEKSRIKDSTLENVKVYLNQSEHILKTISNISSVENYFSNNVAYERLIEELTLEASLFKLDEITFSNLDGSNCKSYNLSIFKDDGITCLHLEDANIPFNHWTNHEDKNYNFLIYKTYVRSPSNTSIIGTVIATLNVNKNTGSIKKLFGTKNNEISLMVKNVTLENKADKETFFNQQDEKNINSTVPITFTLPNIKGPNTLYQLNIDKNQFNNLISPFNYILIASITIIFIFIQGFIAYNRKIKSLDRGTLFKISNGIALEQDELENCPEELYYIDQEIKKLRKLIDIKDAQIIDSENNLKISRNVIQREFSERVEIIRQISKQTYIDRENSVNRLKNKVRTNVNAAHIKLESIHDDLIDLNASYESIDKIDDTNKIVEDIGHDILSEVDSLNPFSIRNQRIRDSINDSDVALALRNNGFTLNINNDYQECNINSDAKHLIQKVILDILFFLLEDSSSSGVIDLQVKAVKEKVISITIDTNCPIKESMLGNKYYHLEIAKERANMFGINLQISLIPVFTVSFVYIDIENQLEYHNDSYNN